MVAALNAPKDDRFQIITEHPVGDFVSEAGLAGRDSERCSACVCDSIDSPALLVLLRGDLKSELLLQRAGDGAAHRVRLQAVDDFVDGRSFGRRSMTMSCACLLSARGEVALREARDLILLGVFGMSAASPALSASSSAGASRGSIPGAANPALVATSGMSPRLSSCRQTVSSRLARTSLIFALEGTQPAALSNSGYPLSYRVEDGYRHLGRVGLGFFISWQRR